MFEEQDVFLQSASVEMCFASVYVCDFQRINKCVFEKEVSRRWLKPGRNCLPLWTQWKASSRFTAVRQLNNLKPFASHMMKNTNCKLSGETGIWFGVFNSVWLCLQV